MSYLPGKNLTVIINSKTLTVQTSNLTEESEEIDVTNTTSAGAYDAIAGIKTVSFDYDMVMDGASLETLTTGVEYTGSWAVSSGHSASGTVILFSKSHKAGAKGAYTVSGRAKFIRAVTIS